MVKATEHTFLHITGKQNLYATTLVGDIVSNGFYYEATATKYNITSGLVAGMVATALQKNGTR